MAREEKAKIIDELQEILSKASVTILTNYQGITGSEMTELHRKFRNMGVEYRVVKNTLARFAAVRAGKDDLSKLLEGPTAFVVGYGDITEPARALLDYIRMSKSVLSVKGGFLGDRLLTARDVDTLSTLPSREILLAKVLGGMQAPIVGLVSQLSGLIGSLSMVLQARIQQLEGK